MSEPVHASTVQPTIGWDDFARIDVRVGTVVAASLRTDVRKPAIALEIDFGPAIGRRRSSAQVTEHYRPEALVGRQVAAVLNFPPKQIGRFVSECLVLGFPDADGAVVLVGVDRPVPNGGRLF